MGRRELKRSTKQAFPMSSPPCDCGLQHCKRGASCRLLAKAAQEARNSHDFLRRSLTVIAHTGD